MIPKWCRRATMCSTLLTAYKNKSRSSTRTAFKYLIADSKEKVSTRRAILPSKLNLSVLILLRLSSTSQMMPNSKTTQHTSDSTPLRKLVCLLVVLDPTTTNRRRPHLKDKATIKLPISLIKYKQTVLIQPTEMSTLLTKINSKGTLDTEKYYFLYIVLPAAQNRAEVAMPYWLPSSKAFEMLSRKGTHYF